ncbi:hypothetical protein D3C87_2006480 [compost metagenome]
MTARAIASDLTISTSLAISAASMMIVPVEASCEAMRPCSGSITRRTVAVKVGAVLRM